MTYFNNLETCFSKVVDKKSKVLKNSNQLSFMINNRDNVCILTICLRLSNSQVRLNIDRHFKLPT